MLSLDFFNLLATTFGKGAPERAREEVSRWMNSEYSVFKRFVLWSSGNPGGFSNSEAVDYLTEHSESTLWGLDTRHELMMFLGRVASSLSTTELEKLSREILVGPQSTSDRLEG